MGATQPGSTHLKRSLPTLVALLVHRQEGFMWPLLQDSHSSTSFPSSKEKQLNYTLTTKTFIESNNGRNGELLLAGRGPCFYYHFFPKRCAKHKPEEPIMVLWEFTFFKRASVKKGKFKIIHQVLLCFFFKIFSGKSLCLCCQREQRLSS